MVGVTGVVLADRLLGLNYASGVKQRFEASLNEEFTMQDGSIVPIRSELTGFTVHSNHTNTEFELTTLIDSWSCWSTL